MQQRKWQISPLQTEKLVFSSADLFTVALLLQVLSLGLLDPHESAGDVCPSQPPVLKIVSRPARQFQLTRGVLSQLCSQGSKRRLSSAAKQYSQVRLKTHLHAVEWLGAVCTPQQICCGS